MCVCELSTIVPVTWLTTTGLYYNIYIYIHVYTKQKVHPSSSALTPTPIEIRPFDIPITTDVRVKPTDSLAERWLLLLMLLFADWRTRRALCTPTLWRESDFPSDQIVSIGTCVGSVQRCRVDNVSNSVWRYRSHIMMMIFSIKL